MVGSKLLGLVKPEYVFRPGQLMRRLITRLPGSEFIDFILPWGLPLRVRPSEAQGRALCLLGVYDLAVTETLWRLLDEGETTVDSGANIGYMTAVMAGRLVKSGAVLCFEPHPQVFQELTYNITRWQQLLSGVHFQCCQEALSDKPGTLILVEPRGYEHNRGLARVAAHHFEAQGSAFEVAATRLQDALAGIEEIHVLKLDVEGHEWNVLHGAVQFLRDHRVRDVVFEEHKKYPTAASDLLEACGYHIYRIQKTFMGPRLLPPDVPRPPSSWEPTSFLATYAPQRARQRLSARGWCVLQERSSLMSARAEAIRR